MRKWDFTTLEAKAEYDRRVRETMERGSMSRDDAEMLVAALMWDEQTDDQGVES